MFKLLLASNNPGKIAEFQRLLNLPGLQLVSATEAGLPADFEVEETGTTFEANACLKATAYALAAQMYALADDSGLMVTALNGAPGVYSKRFAGEHLTDAERNAVLLERMQHLPLPERTAQFVATLAIANPTGEIIKTVEGVCQGYVTTAPRGTTGFGLDPVFAVIAGNPGIDHRTYAELTPTEKDIYSHRGLAIAALRPYLLELITSSF